MSALAYTATNVCMRQLTRLHCDPIWAVCGREFVTSAVIAPWLIRQAVRGRPTLPAGRTILGFLLIGLVVEIVGNVSV